MGGALAWAADIAHDIDSEAGYIRNHAYWLLHREPDLSDQARLWATEIAVRTGELADMSRDALSTRSQPRRIRLFELLRRKIENWQPRYCRNVSITVSGDDQIEVSAYQEQIWRAVRQLLRNAAEAMNYKGEISLQIRDAADMPKMVELYVRDMGPGISDDGRQRIFAEPYSTKNGPEHGLGLLIAQWLIKSMRGDIRLLNKGQTQGAEFLIQLPVLDVKFGEQSNVNN